MNKNIMFIDSPQSISSKVLKKHGIEVYTPYQYNSHFAFRFRYLMNLLHLDIGFLSDVNREILNKYHDIIVVGGSVIFEPFIRQLRMAYPNAIIKFMYSNIIADKASINPDTLRRYKCEPYSWDISDCKKYGLSYAKACFDSNIVNLANYTKYDLCFIGADKGRYKKIKAIEEYANKNGLTSYMHICPNYNILRHIHKYYKNPIPYNQYLDIVSKSKCIIDLVQEGQSGTTMRTMEALFSGQKLISNNTYLKQMDFYRPENIYILTDDNIEGIKDFLDTKTVPVDYEILKTYTFDYWYSNIIDEND